MLEGERVDILEKLRYFLLFFSRMTEAYQLVSLLCPFLASNDRERMRLRAELGKIKGALPLLMKVRNGGNWTSEERSELKRMMRSASSVSPYLLIWALPGSLLFLPFLAWHLDARRKERERETTKALS